MTYSIIGILAAIVLVIINRDVLHPDNRDFTPAERNYRRFLLGVMAYYVTDLLWGILEARRLTGILYADTAVHFVAMAAAVMLWTRYVVAYLDQDNAFGHMLARAGQLFFSFQTAAVVLNFFRPVLFWFDGEGGYHAGLARYASLTIQILLFLLTSVYTLWSASQTVGRTRHRHFTVGIFGIAMVLLISIQVFYPLLPLYAMGYMLGTCLLHSFVLEDEKEEYRRELKDALAAAESANKAKTAFLSSMSHEIRTPMNAIIGLNDIARNDPSASDTVKEHLQKIDASAQHLLGIINEILDMSRIESGRMTIQQEEFSFTECLEQVNTMIGGQCREKGLSYDCRVLGQVEEYYIGDATKLKQAMINILGNSVKFTPPGGEVSLQIEEGTRYDNKAVLKFTFRDTGIGMSEAYLPHLFEVFTQEDSSSTSRYGSTGLGMPITKSIVELMNGHIDVTSEKGKGTTFTVTVTLGRSDRKSAVKEAGAPAEPKQTADLKGRRVLLAEDVPVNAEILMMLLNMREMEGELAENGQIALDMFSASEPGYYDAVLMDMRMPVMDGLEATRRIRALDRPDAARIPIIALTANAFEEDVQRSLQAGLNAHLSKPVEPETLFKTLEELIPDE